MSNIVKNCSFLTIFLWYIFPHVLYCNRLFEHVHVNTNSDNQKIRFNIIQKQINCCCCFSNQNLYNTYFQLIRTMNNTEGEFATERQRGMQCTETTCPLASLTHILKNLEIFLVSYWLIVWLCNIISYSSHFERIIYGKEIIYIYIYIIY